MNDYILEVCVDSAESALAAAKGGASRLELCQNLVIGGTTPGSKLFEVIRRQTTIPIHALIRPRFGDFCYTPYELEEIREEVAMYRELGAEGVVVGVLKEDGTMNMAAMEQLMEAADGMSVTLHRAFDVCRDPKEALEQAVSLGMNTILTSGQQNSAVKGAVTNVVNFGSQIPQEARSTFSAVSSKEKQVRAPNRAEPAWDCPSHVGPPSCTVVR